MEGKNFEKFHYLVIQLLHEVAAAKSKEEIRLWAPEPDDSFRLSCFDYFQKVWIFSMELASFLS